MKLLVLVSFACLAYVQAISEEDLQQKWSDFQTEYGKSYRSPLEARKRFLIFKNNVESIEAHNALYEKGEVSYNKGINQFGDWTEKEFMDYVNKGKFDKPSNITSRRTHEIVDDIEVPKTIDWRTKGAVTDVKDQGQCGSCWAFSTTGSVEGQYFLKKKKLVSFSEQQLVDCSDENDGCGGGLMDAAFEYIQEYGIEKEADYPYKGVASRCQYKKKKAVTKVSGLVDVESGNEAALKDAVITKGPVSVAIDATNGLQFYKSGIFDDKTCGNKRGDLNHGVLVVGIGSTDKSNKQQYYIVKNSWGKSWGESGYFRYPYNKKNKCGIATLASYPVIKK